MRPGLRPLEKAIASSERLAAGLGRVTVILHGSYARGDFNLRGDIDFDNNVGALQGSQGSGEV